MSECLAITDGGAGNERQALALAEALGLPVRAVVLNARAPWAWLAPRLISAGRLALSSEHREMFAPPWPILAIGCGRDAAFFTRLLGALSERRCHTLQILNPRIDPRHWDLVIAPRHDQLNGPNVLTPLGSLNPVDDAWLASGRESCPTLADLPQPRHGVLLGGLRKGMVLDQVYAQALAAGVLARYRREGGSVMLLASRRTPATLLACMRDALNDVPGLIWGGPVDGLNPYPGVLAWADRLLVTPDSVNMLSEACAVGCPVHTMVGAPLPERLARFHAALRERGLLHDMDADTAPTQPPLRETAALAAEVRRRLALPPPV